MSVKLIIFDLDGTLVDSAADITVSLNHALSQSNMKSLAEDKVKTIIGEGITRLIEQALSAQGAALPPGLEDKVAERFLEHYSRHLLEHTVPYPGVLKTLRNLLGFKKAVISNKRYGLTKNILDGLGISGHFDMVVGPDTAPGRKPSAAPILHVLEALGFRAEEAVIVGDSPLDIEAGKAAGLKSTVGVVYGYGSPASLAGADYMLDRIEKLVHILYENEPMLERRKDPRLAVPETFQRYINLVIETAKGPLPAQFIDLSLSGLSFESPIALDAGRRLSCVVSIPKSLTREVRLSFEVMHCRKLDEAMFLVGARITEVVDEMWFKVLKNVFSFIEERKGEMF